uniref:Uncharacterized protein LOC105124040 isoform X1 n=1 Tax=Rhizophora mucronata TaxID=61149 RepID=A0A2P2JCR9_RHIMU
MGRLPHLLDYNRSSMARKIAAHRPHVDGLEAPRNSLEFQVETSQRCLGSGNGLYSCQVEDDWSIKNSYPVEASMKRLINEEISKQSKAKKNSPSIVARLMGVDMLPVDTKSTIQPIDKKNGSTKSKFSKKEKNAGASVTLFSSKTKSGRHMDLNLFYNDKEMDTDRWSNGLKLGRPRHREHPQEEELQKFKKDFEAWQAARFNECSRVVELGGIPGKLLAQGNIDRPKQVTNAYMGLSASERHVEDKDLKMKTRFEKVGLRHHKYKMERFPVQQKHSTSPMKQSSDLESISSRKQFSVNYDRKLDKSSASTRIVILKPGPSRICKNEESWTSSSCTLEDRGSIEDFLEEVKEQLKSELQEKALRRAHVVRGSEIETPFGEGPSDQKQIAQHIVKQVRESAACDTGRNLLRSESTRSSRSEIQFNGTVSPEFINRETRRFLSDRLRNVLNRETHYDVPLVVGETSKTQNGSGYWEIMRAEEEMQTRSFRHGDENGMLNGDLSPRNLIRSLSAPVSGTSFGKLLLEDRHILTGAQIRRKHEALENVSVDKKKRKKGRFSIKETVSNIRYGFTLKGRLLGKKMQSMESYDLEQHPAKDIMNGPTVTENFGRRHIMENSTEVPPSPASACSSPQEEFWRPADDFSLVSTPDPMLREDNDMPQVFREISSNLKELRRQLNQLESDEPGDTMVEHKGMEFMVDIEDTAEAYVRDLLVASGLYYNGSSDRCLQRWDTLAKPISDSIFDEVEESCKRPAKDNETTGDQKEKVDRKVLFDLLNEALSIVLGPPTNTSRFRRKINGSLMPPPLRGKKLLDCVWEMIREYVYPPDDDKSYYSLDTMVARNLGSTPWSTLINDEVDGFGKEMECLIMGDLIEETVENMHLGKL